MVKEGGKVLGMYRTLGRYDGVLITEARDEKAAMKALLRRWRWGTLICDLQAIHGKEA